ncbi:MAG TPA: histidine kinase, partial [Candidatus Limnocylindria bacterium]|nr:histidine kinase [Candidatus Limnocylindria bacterium]
RMREAVTWVPSFPDLAARLTRAVTVAIDRSGTAEANGHGLPLVSRLRIATFFALACGIVFLPVEGSGAAGEASSSLFVLYVWHGVLTSFVLIASFTARGERNADRLAVLLVIGHAVNLHVYVWVWPAYPGLAAGILACMLMGDSVLFGWSTRRVLALAAGFSAGFLVLGMKVAPDDIQRPDFAVASIVLLVGAATAVGCTHLVAMLRASLAERQEELSALSERLMSVQEEERRRLARELHDEFGQTLTAVNANLWLLERQAPADADALRHRATETRRLVARTLGAMRELSQLLRPSVLDALGLMPSLDTLVGAFGEHHQIAISLTSDGLPERLPAELETALYRITQEALTNVARHARAARVRVALTAMGGQLRLEIEDDGIGLATPNGGKPPPGTGLVGIRERVRALGGQMVLHGERGLRLEVRVPLADGG